MILREYMVLFRQKTCFISDRPVFLMMHGLLIVGSIVWKTTVLPRIILFKMAS